MSEENQLVATVTTESFNENAQKEMVTNLLAAAPSIALLGQLQLVSASIDFSLLKDGETSNCQYLKFPDSFRASLLQITHAGWDAFQKAEVNMERISLNSKRIPGYVGDIHEILTEGDESDLVDVPVNLEGIKRVLTDCKESGDEILEKFEFVSNLLTEIMGMSKTKQQRTEEFEREVDRKIASGEIEKSERQNAINKMQKSIDGLEAREEKQRKKYEESLDDMTSAGAFIKGIVSDMIEPCMKLATGVLAPQMVIMQGVGQIAGGGGSQSGQGGQAGQGGQGAIVDTTELKIQLSKLKEILGYVKAIFQKNEKTGAYEAQPGNNAATLKTELETILSCIGKQQGNSQGKTTMTSVCNKVIGICDTLSSNPPEDATALYDDVVAQESTTNGIAFTSGQGDDEGSSSDKIQDSYAKAADGRQKMMETTQKRLDAERERQYQQMDKMAELMGKLKELDMQKQTVGQVISVLKEGILLFSQIKEQWMKLIMFFEKVKQLIDISMAAPTEDFAAIAETGLNRREGGKELSNLKKKTLSRKAIQAVQGAWTVHMVSSVYHTISQEHFSKLIAEAASYAALDAEDEALIKQKQVEIHQMSTDAKDGVNTIVKEYHDQIDTMFAEFTEGLDELEYKK